MKRSHARIYDAIYEAAHTIKREIALLCSTHDRRRKVMNWPLADSYGLWFSTAWFLIHQVRGPREITFAPGTSNQDCPSGQCPGPRSWQRSRACELGILPRNWAHRLDPGRQTDLKGEEKFPCKRALIFRRISGINLLLI